MDNRAAVKQRIVDLLTLAPDLSEVTVSYTFDGTIDGDVIFLGNVEGTKEFKYQRAGQMSVEDKFDFFLVFQASPSSFSPNVVDERCAEMISAAVEAIAVDPHLKLADQVVPGLTQCLLGTQYGPDAMQADNNATWISVAQLKLNCRSYMTKEITNV